MKRTLLSLACVVMAPLAFAQAAAGPDLIITNAKVFTGDAAARFAQAIAITGDHVSAVGTNDQVAGTATDKTKRLDAKGRVIIPGFNDAHTHVCTTPAFQLPVKIESSADDVRAAVESASDETPGDMWITGVIGMKPLDDPTFNSTTLDKISHGHRVFLITHTGHAAIVNSAALQALRTNDSHDPAGGWWQRDASGRSTGKAFEYAEANLQRRWAEDVSEDEAIEDLQRWAENMARLGVTSAQVMPCLGYSRFEKFVRHASLPIRVRVIAMPNTIGDDRNTAELRDMPKPSPARSMLNVSGIKWILDGTPIERGAAMRANYEGTKENGKLNFTNEQIANMLKESVAADEQILLHVVGDRTTDVVLDAFKTSGRTDWKTRRPRIEHGDGITAEELPLIRDLGIVVVENPTHQGPFAKQRLIKSLVKAGIPVAIGSDGPPSNPFNDLERAVTNPANANEALTREEAVDAYTRGAAFAEFTEGEKGTLAPGKLADLAVLSQDIFTVSSSSIPATTSVLTIANGKVIYD